MNIIKQGKTNWKYIGIVIFLALLTTGAIFIYQQDMIQEMVSLLRFSEIKKPEEAEDETANWKTYTNEEYGFEIKYPELVCGNVQGGKKRKIYPYGEGEKTVVLMGYCLEGKVEVDEKEIRTYVGRRDRLEENGTFYLQSWGYEWTFDMVISKESKLKEVIKETKKYIQEHPYIGDSSGHGQVLNSKEEQILLGNVQATKISYEKLSMQRVTLGGEFIWDPNKKDIYIFVNENRSLKIFITYHQMEGFVTEEGIAILSNEELTNQMLSTFRFLE